MLKLVLASISWSDKLIFGPWRWCRHAARWEAGFVSIFFVHHYHHHLQGSGSKDHCSLHKIELVSVLDQNFNIQFLHQKKLYTNKAKIYVLFNDTLIWPTSFESDLQDKKNGTNLFFLPQKLTKLVHAMSYFS